MGKYIFTRKEAAKELDISVRSIDRYIKSGKLRSKKKWKIVHVHKNDVKNFWWSSVEKKHIIITQDSPKEESRVETATMTTWRETELGDYWKLTQTFEGIYAGLKSEIEKKDDLIQRLSMQVWQSQEQMKHSISVTEHNRSQMLLEESRWHITKQMTSLSDEKRDLEQKLKDEKFDKKILILFVFLLLAISAYFFFKNV